MKFVSIDIETTGLDPQTCDVLEIGAFINTDDDTPISELPIFRYRVLRDVYAGSPYALAMHRQLFSALAINKPNVCWPAPQEDYTNVYGQPRDFAPTFSYWLNQNGIESMNFIAAGKNFANFDNAFLQKMPGMENEVRWHHRILDPASMYVRPEDEYLPGTPLCCKRAGIDLNNFEYEGDPHTALYDAAVVVALIRKGLEKNGEIEWLS